MLAAAPAPEGGGEAPSPVVGPELRARMGETAVRAAEAVGYTNAGTVEFLLAEDGEFYFLEMNTRLQVEHPITEMVTGLDLARAQILVAQGEPLGEEFTGVEPHGHAIEVRIYAEDPYRGFVPSPGRIDRLRWPEGPGVRVDAGVYEGGEVTIHYDPMLAKLVVWGRDRAEAIARLNRALAEIRVEGIQTTLPLYRALVGDDAFRRADFDNAFLDRRLAAGELAPPAVDTDVLVIAAALEHLERTARRSAEPPGRRGPRSRWHRAARIESAGGVGWS